jgi:hypothetical protein
MLGKIVCHVKQSSIFSQPLLCVFFRKNCKSSFSEESNIEEAGNSSSLLLQSMEPCSVVSTPDIHDLMEDTDARDLNGGPVSPPFPQPEVSEKNLIVRNYFFLIVHKL